MQSKKLTKDQRNYLQALRSPNPVNKGLNLELNNRNMPASGTSKTIHETLENEKKLFAYFLTKQNQVHSAEATFNVVIPRQQLLDFFSQANAQNCLLINACLGFTKPVDEGGQFVIMNRFNFWRHTKKMTDYDIYHQYYYEVYEEKKAYPIFTNFDPTQRIDEKAWESYHNNYMAVFQNLIQEKNQPTQGYLFPVRSLLHVLTAPHLFGKEPNLRLVWGLQGMAMGRISSNFCLWLESLDPVKNPIVLSFHSTLTKATDGNECPPRIPCNPPTADN